MRDDPNAAFILDEAGFDGRPVPQYPEATKGKRAANFLIDYALRMLLTLAVGGLLGMIALAAGREDLLDFDETSLGARAFDIAVAYAIVLVYYTLCEYYLEGTSLGKLLTGTRAVQVDGSPLRLGQAFKRSLWRIVPFEPFSFLGADMGWHDRQTDTKVVDIRQARS